MSSPVFDSPPGHQSKENILAQKSHADPMKTRTGKTRLGPLNLSQLTDLLEKSTRAKDKGKIQNRVNELKRREKSNA